MGQEGRGTEQEGAGQQPHRMALERCRGVMAEARKSKAILRGEGKMTTTIVV